VTGILFVSVPHIEKLKTAGGGVNSHHAILDYATLSLRRSRLLLV
jgi:hypothetical protein